MDNAVFHLPQKSKLRHGNDITSQFENGSSLQVRQLILAKVGTDGNTS